MSSWLIANPIPDTSHCCNKDLNGGYGTLDKVGNNLYSNFLSRAKKKYIKLPVLSLAYLSSILKSKGKNISYSESYEGSLIKAKNLEIEACIVYGSIVASTLENKLIKRLKEIRSDIFVIVVGTFPSKLPELFETADLVLKGEPEKFFMDWDGKVSSLYSKEKFLKSIIIDDLDSLPITSFNSMSPMKHSYRPMLPSPTCFLEASRGCPYSCGYYCTYGEIQGKLIRSYKASRVVLNMLKLRSTYGFNSFQFRDPVFGLKKGFIDEFCLELIKNGYDFIWGIETRSDLLDEQKLRLMFLAGLRSINIGIETPNINIAALNKRKTDEIDHQKFIINACKKLGIKVNAFYILGLENDNYETCLETINYSIILDTYMARYSVCTPYPGTMFYFDLFNSGRIIDENLSNYNQQNLVFNHKYLSPDSIKKLISIAYTKFYIRPKKIISLCKSIF